MPAVPEYIDWVKLPDHVMHLRPSDRVGADLPKLEQARMSDRMAVQG